MGSYLGIDNQTIEDLGIFGKPGKESVYGLYSKTVTQGGAARMEELFRHPLAEVDEINARAAVYQFFSGRDYRFPVDSATMGAFAYYMENNDVRSQLRPEGYSITQRLKDMVAADPEYVFVNEGVQAGLRVFFKLEQFIREVAPDVDGTAYELLFDQLAMAARSPAFAVIKPHLSDRFEVKINMTLLSELDKQLRFEYRSEVLELVDLLYELDVLITVGQIARARGFTFAKALPAGSRMLEYRQVYHPLVENAIANDFCLSERHNVLFLTGANMAGKSTLMKSIGIALYLAHMGFPVAAGGLQFAVRDGIYTSINLADNLNAGASHYYAEVLRVKEVAGALQSGRQLLVIFDEMFRSPLSDAAAINRRVASIQYLQRLKVKLEINEQLTELASEYLTEGRPAYRLSSLFNCYKQKTQEVMYRSEKYGAQQRHMYAVQEVLQSASQLLGQLEKKGKGENPCTRMQQQLSEIVHAPALRKLRAKYPYTVQQMAECQFLFLNKFRYELEQLLHLLYEFDVYLSVADVATARGLVFAQADDKDNEGMMAAENLRHPSLPDAVGNAIRLSRKENLIFLTGANMAGKSTWMKTLGISYYLAHMGFPVAADRMTFTVMDGVFTSINVPDDLSLGWSHFYAEVMRVKHVATEVSSGKRVFILFDELFKGTNVKDAYDATLVVTQKLGRYRRCAFVISTHIIEVGQELMGTENIQFEYMPTVMDGAVPRYPYRLEAGITSDKQGMIIIENEKILEMLM